TCKSWSDIWINEGFASYSEHLIAQYLDPSNFHPNLASAHSNVMSQTGGSIHFSGNDTMNAARIFSGRLTYDKGGAIVHTLRFVTNNDSLWFNTLKGFQNQFKNSTASAMDFMNYFQTQTSINPTQFFNQWYYGEGYPTFDVKWNFVGNTFVLKSDQSTSKPSSVPLFITPMEYQLFRTGAADTTIRVQHNVNNEYYNIPMLGTVTNVFVDPNNWVINKTIGPAFDNSLLPNGIIEENGSSDVKISPNPSNDYFYIALNKADDYLLKVYDSSGRLIKEDAFQDQTFSLDLSPVSEGIYLLELYNKSGKLVYNSKLVKQKN
ncbi:MAG: M1 family aminopeptidase, partial [Bacteroidia bacterium]